MTDFFWDNTEEWKSRDGRVWKLEDMEREHRENVIGYLRRILPVIRNRMSFYWMYEVAMHDGGDAAQDALEAEEDFVNYSSDDELLESLPIVKRLRELNYRPLTSKTNQVLARFRHSELHIDHWITAMDAAEAFGGFTAWNRVGHPFYVLSHASRAELEHARLVLDHLSAQRWLSDIDNS